jgi:hypothetical protein
MLTWGEWKKKKVSAGLTKRRRFVLVAGMLTLGMLIVQRLRVEARYEAIAVLGVMSYALSAWSLFSELRGVAGWLVNLILPTIYPISVALFYFLLPQAWGTQVAVMILFAISMYGLLLSANIFAVASFRTIQLLRAARAVGFLLSIISSALLFHVIFSLHLAGSWTALLVTLTSLLLLWQGSWSHVATTSVRGEFYYALVGAVLIGEMALALTFWLIDVPLASVMLSMGVYVVLGLFQHDLEKRLFSRTVQEYLGFAGIVFVVVSLAVILRWMG